MLNRLRRDELELLICSCPVIYFYELDVTATCDKGYINTHPNITVVFSLVNKMTVEQKRSLCLSREVTGCL